MIAGSPIGVCYVNEMRFLSLVQQWNMLQFILRQCADRSKTYYAWVMKNNSVCI